MIKKKKSEQMEEKGKEADTMEEELSSLEKKIKDLESRVKEMTSSGANDQVHPVYRFNKFDELCSQLIKSFLREGSTIDCVHSHNYGGTASHLVDENKFPLVPTVKTIHMVDQREGMTTPFLNPNRPEGKSTMQASFDDNTVAYGITPQTVKDVQSEGYGSHFSARAKDSYGALQTATSVSDVEANNIDNVNDKLGEKVSDKTTVAEKKSIAKKRLAEWMKEKNHAWNFDPEKNTVMFLGRLQNDKGLPFLDDAINATLEEGCNFIILGEPVNAEAKEKLQEINKKYNIPVFDRGMQGEIGVVARTASDIGVNLAWNETFGLVIGEGHGYGLQMLASTGGGARYAFPPAAAEDVSGSVDQQSEAFSGQSGSGASDEGELDYTVDPKMGGVFKIESEGGT